VKIKREGGESYGGSKVGYIYIYIERERERESEKKGCLFLVLIPTGVGLHLQVYTRQKANQLKVISSLRCSKTCICTCSCT